MRKGFQADLGEGVPRSNFRFPRAQPLCRTQGQGDVAERIKMREEAKILENEAQPGGGIGEGQRTLIQRFQPHKAPKKR